MGERVLFVGDDWAEHHHDVEVMDAWGRVLARLHAMIGEQLGDDDGDAVVQVVGLGARGGRAWGVRDQPAADVIVLGPARGVGS
jgi:hypothetical protein